jgi:hypothetical protein
VSLNFTDKIKVIHDVVGHTLTVWLDDPRNEHVCKETADEVILMKDGSGRVIGFELLNYRPAASPGTGLTVETVIQTQP